jgi:hypothetical protein
MLKKNCISGAAQNKFLSVSAVFPKVWSADHFTSARILKLVREKINSTRLKQ